MKYRDLFIFDIHAVMQHDDANQVQFVAGFADLISKIRHAKIRILVPTGGEMPLSLIEGKLAELNLTANICPVSKEQAVADFVNHAYVSNCYVFVHRLEVARAALKRTAAVIQIDHRDNLLPERDRLNVKDYNVVNYLFDE